MQYFLRSSAKARSKASKRNSVYNVICNLFPLVANTSFRKGFAYQVASRLRDMKKDEEESGRTIQINNESVNQSAMVVRGKNATEMDISKALMRKTFPRLGTSSGFSGGGSGRGSGRDAGRSVGLSKQVSGRSSLRLAGS